VAGKTGTAAMMTTLIVTNALVRHFIARMEAILLEYLPQTVVKRQVVQILEIVLSLRTARVHL
jgi:hypothetical protein